ncbi:hypothetical protein PGT21_022429 [Puccinia graminis f. sp. tritici]|uniref:Uncharacterized protein n=1 Tax=Puccinia graminis f. sp. tritici TaxID=56615 RepID=A0A5B0QJ99_PUCGR|nr:hypothetical protein PGT21_022429 [Puccinia graminis f. sp. tritici]KAA1113693.1 hypothetical protein PGTUg99_021004 [Puccinia graminis f. sp. tritici]
MTEGVSSVLEQSSLCRMRPCSDERDWLSPMSIGVLSAEQAYRTLGSPTALQTTPSYTLISRSLPVKHHRPVPQNALQQRPLRSYSSMTEGVSSVMEE